MPEIVRFYGIVIKMFFSDHAPPHIQALSMIEGDLPNRAQKLVLEWLGNYQKDVLIMWNEQKTNKLPPLK
jgi:hypothetical protein